MLNKFNKMFELAMYVLAGICLVYFSFFKNWPKVFEPVLIVAVLLGIKYLLKRTKITLFPILKFFILLFIFVAMFLGNEFGYYSKIPFLDKFEHLVSGVILFYVGLTLYEYLNRDIQSVRVHPKLVIWFGIFFSVAMAGAWEIWEYTGDNLLGFRSQNGSLNDTMKDIICGTIGAAVTGIYYNFTGNKSQSA